MGGRYASANAMLIVIVIYIVLMWLVFFKLKWLPFNRLFGTLAALVGVCIVLVFVGLLSYLTPSGKVEIMGKVNEVTPNVSGQVTEVPVQRNVLLKVGTVLFQIDRAPYEYKVRQLKAALAEARQKVDQLKANVDVAAADVKAMQAQWERADKRREDLEQLGRRQATSQFNVEDAVAQANALAAQLDAAKAREVSAKLAASSEINGENTTVAQLAAQLDYAQWELDQTTVRAPADGYVAASTLAVGDRASSGKSAMGFVVASEIEIIGIFPQNGFQTICPGAQVRLAFSNAPGRIHEAQVVDVLRAVGEGQFAASGAIPHVSQIGLTDDYAVRIGKPKDLERSAMRPGMSGTATVFSEGAGAIGMLASILLWVKAHLMYL
jgi:multidrug resistance efflux pump